jgi:glutamate decarboxylase
MFLRLGVEGYRRVQQAAQDVALYLSGEIAKMSQFELWNDGRDIPVFAWRLRAGHTENWNLYHLSDRLRMRGWLVPAYPLPDGLQDLTVQRIVVRNGLSRDLAERFLADLKTEVAFLDKVPGPIPTEGQTAGFHH